MSRPMLTCLGLLANACTLTQSLDELSSGGGSPGPTTGASITQASASASQTVGSTTTATTVAAVTGSSSTGLAIPFSCENQLKLAPGSPDGMYTIDPDAAGPRPAGQFYCDMTQDGGGWLLVTPDLVESTREQNVTVVSTTDVLGGIAVRVYANAAGCSGNLADDDVYGMMLGKLWGWKEIRAHYVFAGASSCWGVFGDLRGHGDTNLELFDMSVDVVRNEVRMGGSTGDAFLGNTNACNDLPENFWQSLNGLTPRSLDAILRRKPGGEAGLGTATSCTLSNPGTAGPTYWEHSAVFIR